MGYFHSTFDLGMTSVIGEGDVVALSEAEIGVKPDHDAADLDTRCSE